MKPDLAKYCLTLALTSACSMYIVHGLFLGQIDCLTACHNRDTDSLVRDYCGCFDSSDNTSSVVHLKQTWTMTNATAVSRILNGTTVNQTTLSTTTTEDICVYLCAIQMGGNACGCSKPILGRK